MTCFFCKGEMKPSTTIHTVQLKNCVVVIKNVPCLKCEQCGEVVLSADTVEKIEHILQTVEKAVAEITLLEIVSHETLGQINKIKQTFFSVFIHFSHCQINCSAKCCPCCFMCQFAHTLFLLLLQYIYG